MKDTFYFSHDYNARNDEKIKNLIYKLGFEGYGIYWAIIEELYQNTNVLRNDYDRIAYELHTDYDKIKAVIEDFDLFVIEDGKFGSLSVQDRLNKMAEKSKTARENIQKRWGNTTVIQPYQSGNTIKENKIKENKINNNPLPPKGGIASKLDFLFVEADYAQSFRDWIEYKKQKNQAYKTQKSLEACYSQLKEKSGNSPEVAAKIVKQSLANNWAGLFELKNQTNGIERTNNRTENRNELNELARRSGEFLRTVAGSDV